MYCNRQIEVVVNYQWYLRHERSDIAWLGRERLSAAMPGVWLIHFGLDAAPARAESIPSCPRLAIRLGGGGVRAFRVSPQAPGDATIIWTTVHLVPAR